MTMGDDDDGGRDDNDDDDDDDDVVGIVVVGDADTWSSILPSCAQKVVGLQFLIETAEIRKA